MRRSLVTRGIFKRALADSVVKLLPQWQWKNPVMFVVYIGSILTTVLWLQAVAGDGEAPAGFILAVTLWLWFTVCFPILPKQLPRAQQGAGGRPARGQARHHGEKNGAARRQSGFALVAAASLRLGDIYLVEAGEFIPADGEVIEGVASVDESAITGESAR